MHGINLLQIHEQVYFYFLHVFSQMFNFLNNICELLLIYNISMKEKKLFYSLIFC
jgi:hypothetical protein